MSASLVGSEMCIRDRHLQPRQQDLRWQKHQRARTSGNGVAAEVIRKQSRNDQRARAERETWSKCPPHL
eukprot:9445856-Alexandrium_andersonii.AAC.1